MESTFPDSQYHSDFLDCPSNVDFTVTLVSREKTLFRVSANVLKTTSRVFAAILSLPQPEGSPSQPPIDNLEEDATTIEGLLRMITGKEFPLLDTVDAIEPLALAANKWVLRMLLLRDSTLAETQPIKVYSLGCCLEWGDVVNLATRFTCNCNLFQCPGVQDSALESVDPSNLLRLLDFHRWRRGLMEKYFNQKPMVPRLCEHIKCSLPPQIQLLRVMFLENMDRIPPGKPLVEGRLRQMFVASGIDQDETLCTRCGSSFTNTNINKIVTMLMKQWESLPQALGVTY